MNFRNVFLTLFVLFTATFAFGKGRSEWSPSGLVGKYSVTMTPIADMALPAADLTPATLEFKLVDGVVTGHYYILETSEQEVEGETKSVPVYTHLYAIQIIPDTAAEATEGEKPVVLRSGSVRYAAVASLEAEFPAEYTEAAYTYRAHNGSDAIIATEIAGKRVVLTTAAMAASGVVGDAVVVVRRLDVPQQNMLMRMLPSLVMLVVMQMTQRKKGAMMNPAAMAGAAKTEGKTEGETKAEAKGEAKAEAAAADAAKTD